MPKETSASEPDAGSVVDSQSGAAGHSSQDHASKKHSHVKVDYDSITKAAYPTADPTKVAHRYVARGSNLEWFVGLFVASIFSLVYLVAPLYLISCIVLLPLYPNLRTLLFASPAIVSAMFPPVRAPRLLNTWVFKCMLVYFSYEEMHESSAEDFIKMVEDRKRQGKAGLILATQPHGVISYGGLCAGINRHPRFGDIVTAAAGAVLATPFVKHFVGLFNLIDASSGSIKKQLAKDGLKSAVVLYPGGIAELFQTSIEEEVLFLAERKGFIKLALREGADVVPLYFFGNTSVLSIPKSKALERFSRKMQVSLTWFYGLFGLPIPRPNKVEKYE
jgi:2-acylglycerol O-acyltransferase 2